jgi:hypothetical protein
LISNYTSLSSESKDEYSAVLRKRREEKLKKLQTNQWREELVLFLLLYYCCYAKIRFHSIDHNFDFPRPIFLIQTPISFSIYFVPDPKVSKKSHRNSRIFRFENYYHEQKSASQRQRQISRQKRWQVR